MVLYLVSVVAVLSAIMGVLGGFYWAHKQKGSTNVAPPTPFSRVLGVCMIVLAVAFGAEMLYFQNEQNRAVDCQYRVNQGLIAALTARNEPVNDQTQRLIEMVRAIRDSKSDAETRVAMSNFLQASEELQNARRSNPYPDINQCR